MDNNVQAADEKVLVNQTVMVNGIKVSRNQDAKLSKVHKTINIKVLYKDADFDAILQDHAKRMVIKAVNGGLRKEYDNLVANQTYEIEFGAKATRTTITVEKAKSTLAGELAGKSELEQLQTLASTFEDNGLEVPETIANRIDELMAEEVEVEVE